MYEYFLKALLVGALSAAAAFTSAAPLRRSSRRSTASPLVARAADPRDAGRAVQVDPMLPLG